MSLGEGAEDGGGVVVELLGVGEVAEGFEGADEVSGSVEVEGIVEEADAPAHDGLVLPLLVEALLLTLEVGELGVGVEGGFTEQEQSGEGFVVVGGGVEGGEEVGAGAGLSRLVRGGGDIVEEAFFEGEDAEVGEDLALDVGEVAEYL